MRAIMILKRCRAAKGDIQKIKQRIEQRREVLTSISAPQADPIGGSRGSADPDKNGRILAEIDQLERELQAREEAWAIEQAAAPALLDMVPELEGKVLYDYYVRGWETPKIAMEEKYTNGYVRKTKRNGEQLLEMVGADLVNATLPAWYIREKGEKA